MSAEAATPSTFDRLLTRARIAFAGRNVRVLREGPTWVWYGAFTVVLFVVCLVATFPHDLLLQRALQGATAGSALRIETGAGRLGWTLAYGIDSLRLRPRNDDGEPLLQAESLRFAPSRLGLLFGSPYPLGISAALYGGTLRGTIDPRPATFRVDATLAGLDLARYTGLRTWVEGTVRGRLDGTVALDGAGRGPAAATGAVELRVPGLALEGVKVSGIVIPDLHFGEVHATGTVKNSRLEIEEIAGDGQEVDLRGNGNVLLREPLESSILSLDLVLTPTAGASDGLKALIGMIPGNTVEGGGRRIAVVGSLGRPQLR